MFLSDLLIGSSAVIIIIWIAFLVRGKVTDKATRPYFVPALLVKICGALALGLIYHFYYDGGDTFAFHKYGSKIIWEAFMDDPLKGIKLWISSGVHTGEIFEYSSRIWFWGFLCGFLNGKPSAYLSTTRYVLSDLTSFVKPGVHDISDTND